jgi:hypothetical protein
MRGRRSTSLMTMTVQSAGAQPWVDLALVVPPPTPPAPAIASSKAERHANQTRVHAVVPVGHYERSIDSMRLQAYKRDAAQAAANLGTQAPAATATAATASAPAVKAAPVQVNPAAMPAPVVEPVHTPAPEAPAVRAPTAVDAQSGSARR